MSEGKMTEMRPVPAPQEDGELTGMEALPERKMSLAEIAPEGSPEDEELAAIHEKIEAFVKSSRTYDGFTDPDSKRNFLTHDLLSNGRPRTAVAHELERDLARDPELVAFQIEMYKKFGRHALNLALDGDPSVGQIDPYEFRVQDWYSEGKEVLMENIRMRAEGHSKNENARRRKTRFQKLKGSISDNLRGMIPDKYALQVKDWEEERAERQLRKKHG